MLRLSLPVKPWGLLRPLRLAQRPQLRPHAPSAWVISSSNDLSGLQASESAGKRAFPLAFWRFHLDVATDWSLYKKTKSSPGKVTKEAAGSEAWTPVSSFTEYDRCGKIKNPCDLQVPFSEPSEVGQKQALVLTLRRSGIRVCETDWPRWRAAALRQREQRGSAYVCQQNRGKSGISTAAMAFVISSRYTYAENGNGLNGSLVILYFLTYMKERHEGTWPRSLLSILIDLKRMWSNPTSRKRRVP